MNFDVELAEIMSTQSPNEPTVPHLATPDSHEHRPATATIDLTMDPTVSDPFADALLPKFDAVSHQPDEECRRLQAELQSVQSSLDHLRTYSVQQEGWLA